MLIVGAGFGGIELARHLDKRNYEILLIDRNNYFTFQPLLYQVATGGLEPDSVAYPIRKIFNRKNGIVFRVAEVRMVHPEKMCIDTSIGSLPYDLLVLATGSCASYFGNEQLAAQSLSLKSVSDALNIRSFILQNLESALLTTDVDEKNSLMNFLVVGAGPTGIEVAGALAELKKHVLPNDYPELDIAAAKITIVEAGEKVLNVMSEKSSRHALRQLEELGINFRPGMKLENYDGETAVFSSGETIKTKALFWTAGVKGNAVQGFQPVQITRTSRIITDSFHQVLNSKTIFAIGDVAAITGENSSPHPMLAPVAIQQGKNLAANLNEENHLKWTPFVYKDRGTMATIGRSRAVADLPGIHLKGFIAWIAWLFIHLMLLVGFRNRIVVLFNWIWNYFSYDRAIRLIIRPFTRPEISKK